MKYTDWENGHIAQNVNDHRWKNTAGSFKRQGKQNSTYELYNRKIVSPEMAQGKKGCTYQYSHSDSVFPEKRVEYASKKYLFGNGADHAAGEQE